MLPAVDWLRTLLRRPPAIVDGLEPLEEPPHGDQIREPFDGPIHIPRTRAQAREVFGYPVPRRPFERGRMSVAERLPGAWNGARPGRARIYCHDLAEPYIREALRRCELAGVVDEIDRLGCFAYRRIRHSEQGPLSLHAFGVAVDLNPRRNRALTLDHHVEPWSDEWRAIWPDGLSRTLVEIWERVGFRWGGRWTGFVDPMHFQLCGKPRGRNAGAPSRL